MKAKKIYIQVPCSERLPEVSGWYHCESKEGYFGLAWFYDGKFEHYGEIVFWLEETEQIVMSEEEYKWEMLKFAVWFSVNERELPLSNAEELFETYLKEKI